MGKEAEALVRRDTRQGRRLKKKSFKNGPLCKLIKKAGLTKKMIGSNIAKLDLIISNES